MRKRYILAISFFVLLAAAFLLALLLGAGVFFYLSGNPSNPGFLDSEADVGAFSSEENRYVLVLPEEEVAEDVFLHKSMVYEESAEGYMGEIVLEFENRGDGKTISYILDVPKSFSKSASDMEYSLQPTVLEDDPVLSWEAKVSEKTILKVLVKAKNAAVPAAAAAGFSAAFSGEDAEEAALKAGSDAAFSAVLDSLEDFSFISAAEKCKNTYGAARNQCLGLLLIKFPDHFESTDCEEFDAAAFVGETMVRGGVLSAACEAVVARDSSLCHSIIYKDLSYQEVDLCKEAAFKAFSAYCADDECMYSAAVDADFFMGCGRVSDRVSGAACKAELSQDAKYCSSLSGDERKYCCNVLSSMSAKNSCLGVQKSQCSREDPGSCSETECVELFSEHYWYSGSCHSTACLGWMLDTPCGGASDCTCDDKACVDGRCRDTCSIHSDCELTGHSRGCKGGVCYSCSHFDCKSDADCFCPGYECSLSYGEESGSCMYGG